MFNFCNCVIITFLQNNLDYEKNVSSNGVMELSDGEGEVLPSDTVEVYELSCITILICDFGVPLKTILMALYVCPFHYS